ncbi:methenyltetrahydromethanopterin cyclohydrolase [Halodesulfurarchaeum sp.]|uniref:methenyltetrahydromethanopterin cyclohydrolase n=1 Tax=Halodesulfurarchaeum sp. TaxID=1980530 RepID=UPI002FC34437
MESLNRMAIELADEALEFADELAVVPQELSNGATAIDFGVEADGGIEAGLLLTELQTAGLATVQTRMDTVAGAPFPHVEVSTDQPGLSLLGSQKAGWELSHKGFEALGSGPARALVAEETEFQALDYADAFDLAVLSIETETMPRAGIAAHVADRTDVAPEAVYLPAYRTGSVAGSVSGAGRAAELAVFRLFELGYDPTDVLTASGSAPVPPVAANEETAMGRVNDSVVYGGQVHLTVREDDDALENVASTAAVTYGDPFREIYEHVDWDLSDIDPAVFGPAQVTIDVRGGPTYKAGDVHETILADSFGLE